ncbi:hypothetical protein ALC57_18732 [Trachymyrmex cornetzi]|uniref:DUF4780 domain-containing protein n=1 Tax=Trachymyrmex cornetzi TaxID=471704 RepID=A0A151IR51_9HYME|nr:hypothetical protein ALC57_18732 [Trachymyrmex cornetzi]
MWKRCQKDAREMRRKCRIGAVKVQKRCGKGAKELRKRPGGEHRAVEGRYAQSDGLGGASLQRRHRAVVWVSDPPKPAAVVLVLLERQNPGIGALTWRAFAENVGASPEGRNYVFGILESSVLKLRERDSKLCYGIEQITIKVARSHGEEAGREEPRSKY